MTFTQDSSQEHFSTFEPLVILEFGPDTKQAAQEWLSAKLQAVRINNGAELIVKTNTMDHSKETVLYIGATLERLLIGAEEMKMRKIYKDGNLKEIALTDLDNFQDSGDLENFLTQAQKQRIILKGIESLRAAEDETSIPGYPKHTLYPGKSIVKKYLSRKLITNLFPLHEEEKLKILASEWCTLDSCFKEQPMDKIHQYFGVKIALYFSFLGIYTISLAPPALIGIIYFLYPSQSMYREALFAVFNLIWSTVFLEGWKRYCNTMCYKWGTIDSSANLSQSLEEPRADFYGVMGKNLVTGNPEPQYPKWKRLARFYLVTLPVLSVCLTVAFLAMLAYFWAEDWMKLHGSKDLGLLTTLQNLLPTIVYAVVIVIMNGIYRTLAAKLNKYENHRLQSSYENHLIVKLILFEFINCFICLFYVAFYLQDRALLKTFLGTAMITQQIIGQIQESLVPFLFMRQRQKQVDKTLKKTGEQAVEREVKTTDTEVDQIYKKQVALESTMDRFPGSNDEYLEMYIQFGYVYLFSSAFPLAALWALINNFIEIRSDAFKMCRVFQRPFTLNANSIGAWQPAFEIIGLISVMTNCALIGMDPSVQKLLPSDMSAVNMVLIFVAAEHIVLAIKASVALLIPDMPKWVILAIAKQEYAAKLALRKQTGNEPEFKRLVNTALKKKTVLDAVQRRSTPATEKTQ